MDQDDSEIHSRVAEVSGSEGSSGHRPQSGGGKNA